MRSYLFLALVWLLGAIFVFWRNADEPITILNTGWSIGWLLLAFAAWNLVRWWKTRPIERDDSPRPPTTSDQQSQ